MYKSIKGIIKSLLPLQERYEWKSYFRNINNSWNIKDEIISSLNTVSSYRDSDKAIKDKIFFANMDYKQYSIASSLLLNQVLVKETVQIDCDTYIVLNEFDAYKVKYYYKEFKVTNVIFIDNHDDGFDRVFLSKNVINFIKNNNIKVVYIKLQPYKLDFYKDFILKHYLKSFVFLSAPLLLGGSDKHITLGKDFEGHYLFERNLCFSEQEVYKYNWMFLGSITSRDREEATKVLDDLAKNDDNVFYKIARPGFESAKSAAVPIDDYLNKLKETKVNLSLNGNGVWTLKDGECLARGAFVLRQYHPMLSINKLSPKDGKHWVVFENEDLKEKLEYYINNDLEREKIRKEGFEYFKKMINGGYSEVYMTGIKHFFETGSIEKLEGVIL